MVATTLGELLSKLHEVWRGQNRKAREGQSGGGNSDQVSVGVAQQNTLMHVRLHSKYTYNVHMCVCFFMQPLLVSNGVATMQDWSHKGCMDYLAVLFIGSEASRLSRSTTALAAVTFLRDVKVRRMIVFLRETVSVSYSSLVVSYFLFIIRFLASFGIVSLYMPLYHFLSLISHFFFCFPRDCPFLSATPFLYSAPEIGSPETNANVYHQVIESRTIGPHEGSSHALFAGVSVPVTIIITVLRVSGRAPSSLCVSAPRL